MKTTLSKSAISYAWDQIFYRLGIKANKQDFMLSGKKIFFYYQDSGDAENKSDQFQIRVFSHKPGAIEELSINPDLKIIWLEKKDFLPYPFPEFPVEKLPILIWGDNSPKTGFAEIRDANRLDIHIDLIASIFFMLSRWEEYGDTISDVHGRFPFNASAASRFGFIDLPIVDLYVTVFKYWLEAMIHAEIPEPFNFRVSLSHDIDHISLFRPPFKGIATLAKDTLKLNTRNLKDDFGILFSSYTKDPFYSGFKTLAEQSEKYGFSSTFNLMASAPTFYDAGYSLSSPTVSKMLNLINENGHRIGLHASYYSLNRPEKLLKEKSELEKFTGKNVDIVRSHYLRVKTPSSWNDWQTVGLKRDGSYGFSEHEGFRCGTCIPFQPFDIIKDMTLDIFEEPLIIMDATLKGYRKLNVSEAKETIFRIARLCKFVKGNFTVLWHNTSFFRDWDTWGIEYPEILASLKSLLTAG
jgi:hypothetical protein